MHKIFTIWRVKYRKIRKRKTTSCIIHLISVHSVFHFLDMFLKKIVKFLCVTYSHKHCRNMFVFLMHLFIFRTLTHSEINRTLSSICSWFLSDVRSSPITELLMDVSCYGLICFANNALTLGTEPSNASKICVICIKRVTNSR